MKSGTYEKRCVLWQIPRIYSGCSAGNRGCALCSNLCARNACSDTRQPISGLPAFSGMPPVWQTPARNAPAYSV